jgi:hypothetical protein
MSKKPFEILLTKIIKETLLLEEVNEEKISYHASLIATSLRSESGKVIIHAQLKKIVIGMLKQIAITGSPGDMPLANLVDIAIQETPQFVNNLMSMAQIDQTVDQDLYVILESAMKHLVDALINCLPYEMFGFLGYNDMELKYFNGMLSFINDDGDILDTGGDGTIEARHIRLAYEPNEKIEFMKKLAQRLIEFADDRFSFCWSEVPRIELKDYNIDYGLF